MISYPYIEDLFKNILAKSRGIKGRFFLCPKLGTEMNSDELGQVIQDLVVAKRLEKKAPLSLMMPPKSFGNYIDIGGEWEENEFVIAFLTTTYYSGTNQTMNPNPNTKTSMHTIPQDWHDMKRCAVNFITVLDKVTRTNGLVNKTFRLNQQNKKMITPLSEIGAERMSGVLLRFYGSLFIGCNLEDYDETDILSIELPELDSHPEHQL
jgi:hypothetical protein